MDWRFWVGPAVGIAGLSFAIFAFYKNWKPKRLQYEVRADQEIISQNPHTRWADLSVRFGDRDLHRPRVVNVRVTNTGKVEARGEDFDEPLAVSAGEGDEIIAATIARRQQGADKSQELPAALISPTEVIAPKVLLNEGEWLEFRLLVEGAMRSIDLRGHAAGFSLTPYTPRRRLTVDTARKFSVVAVGITSTAIGIAAFFITPDNTVAVPNVVGKPVQQAVTQINEAGLKLGTVNRVRGSAKIGTVISESPAAGKEVDKDSSISLVVSDGR